MALHNETFTIMDTPTQSSIHISSVLGTALLLGVMADWLFFDRSIGISAPLFVGVCLLALFTIGVREGRLPARTSVCFGIGACGFALALAVRDEPMLSALNLLAAMGLLFLQVAYYQGVAVWRVSELQVVRRVLETVAAMIAQPPIASWYAAHEMRVGRGSVRRFWPLLRGLMLALPVLGCFTLLLVSADVVFASYIEEAFSFQLPFSVDTVLQHGLMIGMMTWLCAGALLAALDSSFAQGLIHNAALPAEGATQRLQQPFNIRFLGSTEALTVLVLVDLLFGGFMTIQAAYFFGGLDTLARTGMTYAEYARRGFFELLAVACLALALLWMLALLTRRQLRWQRQAFNSACGAMIVLVVGMLASAFVRMLLYEEAYGFTRLRLYTHSFMIWLAVVLALFFVALLWEKPRLWSFGTVATALVYLALLNIVSPDTLIVKTNVARYQAGGDLDAPYLADLSADAAPALIDSLALLNPVDRQTIANGLRGQRLAIEKAYAEDGWPSWHWSRWRLTVGG